jgi:hypothetical protein
LGLALRGCAARDAPAAARSVGCADARPFGVLLAASVAAVALRAAVLRALERCGRVRGRLARTLAVSGGSLGRPLLSLGTLTGHIIA